MQLKVLQDKYDNIEQLAEILASGSAEGADFISLPEMWNIPGLRCRPSQESRMPIL